MRSVPLRIAAGLFVLIGVSAGFIIFVGEEGWGKLVAVPIICLLLRFVIYAVRGEKAGKAEKSSIKSILLLLLGGTVWVLAAYLGGLWFGRWVQLLIIAVVPLAYLVLFVVVAKLKDQLARNLSQLDKLDRDRILSGLEPSVRKDVIRRLEDIRNK